MRYLDYSKLPQFLATYFPDREARLVGQALRRDSGYYDIIRFFGTNAIKPDSIEIKFRNELFTFGDSRIKQFSYEVERKMIDEGRLYDGPKVAKLHAVEKVNDNYTFTVQPARYGDQAGSCLALDLTHQLFGADMTLREYYKRKYQSNDVLLNPLAICFGVCGLLLLKENGVDYLTTVVRSQTLSSLGGSIGPSVAGSVEFSPKHTDILQMLASSLGQEVREEMNVQDNEFSVTPLAYAREIFRGERPQIFALIRCSVTRDELRGRLESIHPSQREFTQFDFIELKNNRLSEAQFHTLNHEAQMNRLLLEEYLAGE
ncbi:MAG: hypothetical protein SGI97_10125 [candidate division Zixibacteria bacterium]|nr:hypothetical protein [candidate division Zixibacteria bacterium]